MVDFNRGDDEDDEFFGDQNEEDDNNGPFGGLSKYELQAKEEEMKKLGFLESYDEKKGERLQEGFEAGYQETFDPAFRIGELLGRLTVSAKIISQRQQQHQDREKGDKELENEIKSQSHSIVAKKLRKFVTDFQDRVNKKEVEAARAELDNFEQELKVIIEEEQ